MLFVDTHCHLNLEQYRADLESVIQRALENQVTRIVIPGLDLPSSQAILQLCEQFDPLYAAVGVHPENCAAFDASQLSEFKIMMKHDKVVAVGEIGLDFYHRQDDHSNQRDVFCHMLELALRYSKPVILHSRDAIQEILTIIKDRYPGDSASSYNGVFHAFEGSLVDAENAAGLGFLVGAGGPITYKNAVNKHQLFSKISLTNVVLETDGPYLAPQGYRGTRNEPARIPVIAKRLAELQACDLSQIAEETTKNASHLFNWIE